MEHDPNRRMLITALAGLTLANVSLASAATGTASRVKVEFWWLSRYTPSHWSFRNREAFLLVAPSSLHQEHDLQ